LLVLNLSMHVRLSEDAHASGVGSVLPGQPLCSSSMSSAARVSFLQQVEAIINENSNASWRRLKPLIKQACGGKKKDTDFRQKPAPTRWEFDRV
jgi:hypothetical protein